MYALRRTAPHLRELRLITIDPSVPEGIAQPRCRAYLGGRHQR